PQLRGSVQHVAFADGPKPQPVGRQQLVPGLLGRLGEPGHDGARVQHREDLRVRARPAGERRRDVLAGDVPRRCADGGEVVLDRLGQRRRWRREQGWTVVAGVQGLDRAECGILAQPPKGGGQPGSPRRGQWSLVEAGQRPDQGVELEQRRQREPAVQQVLCPELDTQHTLTLRPGPKHWTARPGPLSISAVTTAAERATYRDVFADPIFRVLFLTRSVAIGADTLRILALSVLVFAITGSPLLTAVTFGIGFVPQVIGGTLLGSLADRLPPRGLIISGYLLECAVATVLGTVRLPVAVSLALVGLVAMLTPIFAGASNRLVAETLRGDAYVLGRSLSSVASGAAQLAGMALGGVAVAALGPQRALLASAACHLAVAVAVRLGLPRLARPTAGTGSAVRQGWAVTTRLLRDREVRGLLLVQWVPPAFVVAAEALVVPYVQLRGFPAGSAGLLLACAPAGMLLGNVVVGRMLRPAT